MLEINLGKLLNIEFKVESGIALCTYIFYWGFIYVFSDILLEARALSGFEIFKSLQK